MKAFTRKDLADCRRNLKQAYTIVDELENFFRRLGNDEMVRFLDNAQEAILECVNHLPGPPPRR
jgi:hypothetical protein